MTPIHTTKATIINGVWTMVPMILTHTPKGWNEQPKETK